MSGRLILHVILDVLLHVFHNPPLGVGQEFVSALRVEGAHGAHHADATLLHKIHFPDIVVRVAQDQFPCLRVYEVDVLQDQFIPRVDIAGPCSNAKFLVGHSFSLSAVL